MLHEFPQGGDNEGRLTSLGSWLCPLWQSLVVSLMRHIQTMELLGFMSTMGTTEVLRPPPLLPSDAHSRNGLGVEVPTELLDFMAISLQPRWIWCAALWSYLGTATTHQVVPNPALLVASLIPCDSVQRVQADLQSCHSSLKML